MYNKHLHKRCWKKSLALTLALTTGISMLPVQEIGATEKAIQNQVTEQIDLSDKMNYEQIQISTPDEFVSFAKKCYIDSWSKDKYVTLKSDIDLSETEFEPISVFNGIFDGEGHKISGFNHVGDGYVVGLFRYIESSGMVQNLKLEGQISSENEKECIGSICGINYGTIKGCTFYGTVSGRDTVGGIVGINESTGTLSKCSSNGRITGYYSTGGIAGINHGAINSCTNRAGINDDSAWVEEDDEMGDGIEIIKNLTSNDDRERYSGVDTGGICGFSDGIISKCDNKGTVGYEHTGYNIGGIAGRQSGVVSLSINSGTVYGRKDIGGIVGQMEPFIEINEAESLRNAINKLHDLIEKTIDDMDAASDGIKSDVDTMQSYADSAIDTGDELVDQLTDFVDNNVDEINTVSDRMSHIMDMVPGILDDVSAAGDSMTKFNNVIKQLAEDLDIIGKLEESSYEETDYNRVSLLSTVGGSITINNSEPETNTEVTITAVPDNGYQLKSNSIKVVDANGNDIPVKEVSGNKNQYKFVMPQNNVRISASFVYNGTFLIKSTVGGRVTTSEDGKNVSFRAIPSSGYSFKQYNVKGSTYTGKINTDKDNEIVLDKSKYITDNTSVVVEAVFEKKSATHKVTVKSGIGGSASVTSGNVAAAGESVTVRIIVGSGYEYSKMLVNGNENASSANPSNVNERIFTMPNTDAEVEVIFKNKCNDSNNQIFAESNAGGNVVVEKGSDGARYQIIIRPNDGYDVSGTDSITFSEVKNTQAKNTNIDCSDELTQRIQQFPKYLYGDYVSTNNEESSNNVESSSSEESSASEESSSNEESSTGEESSGNEESSNNEESSGNEESSNNEESSSNEESSANEESSGNEESSDEEKSSKQSEDVDKIENEEDKDTSTETEEKDISDLDKKTEEENISTNAIVSGTVTKSELTYNSDAGTYKYIVDVSGDSNKYRAFVKFVEKSGTSSDTYNVTTASSTGGTVTADKSSVNKGEKVYVTPVSEDGYVLNKLLLNGSSTDLKLETDGKRYSFIMPSKDAEITALFEPVNIILKSNLSGDATCSGNAEGKVTISVVPDAAYSVKSIAVTDANGKNLSVSKKQSGSYLYEIDITKMSKAPCIVDILFEKQNKKQAVDTSKSNIDNSIKELSKASENAQKSIDKIRNIVTKSDGSYKSWDELTEQERDDIIVEILNLADVLQDMSDAASNIMRDLSTIYNILSPYASDAAEATKNDVKNASEHIQNVLDSLKAANNGVRGIVNYVNGQPDIKFAKLGDEFDITKESFHNQLKGLSESIKKLSDTAGNHSDIINEDLRQINDQLNIVFNLLADRMVDVEHLSIEELYEEVDDEDIDSITTGRADTCTNRGVVKGDINVGGIAGSMSIDDEDPEDSAAGQIEYEIGRRFITKCLVSDSVNEGYVTAKKDGAGGICGYMNHGIIVDSEGYGSVESTEGDYVGGICGESLTIIKRCYSLCSVSGNQNVGGIAGFADTLKNCYSMSDVKAENGRSGAIAGQIASYEDFDTSASDEAKVTGNYYVGDDIYGIDNISYIGVAEPVSYNDLLTTEKLPIPFWHLKVIYKVDDMFLGSEEVSYGTKLDSLNYPQIPAKEGFYGVWPDMSDHKMRGTIVIEPEYKYNVTVVQSNNGQNDLDEEGLSDKPYALVEDIFTEDTILNVNISSLTPPEAAKGKKYIMYDVKLENSDIEDTDTFVLRLLNPYKDATVYGYIDGTWTQVDSKVRGRYLQTQMQGTDETFCIVENKSNILQIILFSVLIVVVVVILITLTKKQKKRRMAKKQKKADKK